MERTATKQDYISVQALRAVAASLVVLFHFLPFEERFLSEKLAVPKIFALGEIGVDLFFLISGFIVTESTRGQFSSLHKALWFLFRRVTRIYPIYWVYCSFILVAYIIHPDIFSGLRGKPDILASFLLIPSDRASLLLVSWSLVFEVQFYILFSIALMMLSERALPTAVSIWAVIIIGRGLFTNSSFGLIDILFSLFNLEFLIGCLIARFYRNIPSAIGLLSFVAGSIILVVGCIMFQQLDGRLPAGWPRILIAGGGFALILLAAVIWESALRKITPRILIALGDSSYSLYLSHLLTGALIGYVWSAVPPHADLAFHVTALVSAFVAALLIGWLSFHLLERPLLRLSRLLADKLQRPDRKAALT